MGVMIGSVLAQVVSDVNMVVASLYLVGQCKALEYNIIICYTYIHILYSQLHSKTNGDLNNQCIDGELVGKYN